MSTQPRKLQRVSTRPDDIEELALVCLGAVENYIPGIGSFPCRFRKSA